MEYPKDSHGHSRRADTAAAIHKRRDIKLVYMAPHGKLYDYGDKLDESVHLERVIFRAAWYVLNRYIQKTHSTDEYLRLARDDYRTWAQEAEWRYPIKGPKKQGKILLVGQTSDYEYAFGENTIT